jgi:hypothetical protein
MKMKKMMWWLVGLILIMGCASTGSDKMSSAPGSQTGFLKGYYDRLAPGPEGGANMR